MSDILYKAINEVQIAQYAFCRFITANDTGKNGSHQAGFYIPNVRHHFYLNLLELRERIKINW